MHVFPRRDSINIRSFEGALVGLPGGILLGEKTPPETADMLIASPRVPFET